MDRSRDHAGVLLVDDDPNFRSGLAEVLRDDGFAVQVYGSPGEVPPLDGLTQISIVITDYEMPEEDGLAFADRFHAAHPAVPIVLLTGYAAGMLEAPLRARRFVHLCQKAFVADELNSLLQQLMTMHSP